VIFDSVLEGFILGLGAAVPLGPINILIMSYALKSYPQAVAIGLGAMSADITYLLLVIFGTATFMEIAQVNSVMTIFGAIFLFYLAYLIFKGRKNRVNIVKVDRKSLLTNYIKGYTLTLLNPYTILFWMSVSAYINSKELNPFFTILGLFLAILFWITAMPLIIYKTREIIPQKLVETFALVSSMILAFFAFAMVWKLIF
jgi:L-lysine exporter family protein LysE/ArgO